MGQKVHPEAMRVGYIHDWKSNWFNERSFSEYLAEDVHVREHITNKLAHAGLSDITIRKDAQELEVNIHTARPGIVIGKSGTEVDALRRDLHRMTKKQIKVNILEIKRPELDAKLVAQSIAEEKYLPFAAALDADEPRFADGKVEIMPEVGRALRAYAEAGFFAAGMEEALGGLGLPYVVTMAVNGMFTAANLGVANYAFLTIANANLIAAFGEIKPTVPFVVRLDGTNDVQGRELLQEAALPNVHAARTMNEAAEKVVELAGA